MSDAPRWDRLQSLFHDVVDLDPAARQAHLSRSCADDPSLIADVEALVTADAHAQPLLDGGVAHAADAILAERSTGVPTHRFGPYRLLALLGEGGMGVVYRGVREDNGAEAAIKILRDASLSPARRERFAAEQRTLARLHHPGIAQLHDADTLPDGTPWFAMELVDGVPLATWCRTHAPDLATRLALLVRIGEAVGHAHGLAIIHRDLKPSNILVTPEGQVKLVDFGIAKQLEADGRPADMTRTGLRLMTPAYAAPEQVRAGPIGVHTDVYALGVIAYELLTGTLPYDLEALTPGQAVDVVLDQEPERPSAVARRVPGRAVRATRAQWADLDVLVQTAMHKVPARRYRTVEAMLRDVAHFRAGTPLDARPDTLGYRAVKFVRRNRSAVLTATLVLAVLATGATVAGVRLTHARDAAVAEAARTQRIQEFMLALFQGGEGEVLAADSLRVGTLLERGLREAAALDAEPAVQAELWATLGGIYQQVGDFSRADSLLQLALVRHRALEGDSAAVVARRLLALGTLRIDQAAYAEAESLLVDAEVTALATSPPHNTTHRAIREARGRVRYEQGDYDGAVALFDTVLATTPVGDSTSMPRAGTYLQLASAHFYAGRYDRSDAFNRRALAIYQSQRGAAHPLVADVLINLGASEFQRGNFTMAESLYREALAIVEPWYGADHHETAAALTMIGRALVHLERRDEARALLVRSLAIQERVHGLVHPRVASALNELASVDAGQDRLDEADAGYRRMEAIYRAVHRGDHWLIGVALSNRGGVAGRRGDHRLAEQHYREAVRLFTVSQGAEHVNTGIARVRLARALLRQGRHREAMVESEAGEAIVGREMAATSAWVTIARGDLAAIYGALGRVADSVRVATELADSSGA